MQEQETLTIEKEEAEKKAIINQYRRLYRRIKPYCKNDEAKMIRKAFDVALKAHSGVHRKSGEPFIYHPIEVAIIVVEEIWPEPITVAAALLHDVVEDSEDWTIEDIEREFGKAIALIVDGVTKIPKESIDTSKQNVSQQAENFKKILIALSKDPRTMFVKLSDRLHNMRTLDSMLQHKQLTIAAESLYLYAPLAHRLGLYEIKSELEDLYLKFTHRAEYDEISSKLEKYKPQRNRYIKNFIEPIEASLKESNIKCRVFGRTKSIHSIWRKMQTQNIPFEEVYDVFAIRIVIDENGGIQAEKQACWRAYSIVTDFYTVNTERLRDWLTNPRPNGYESLHTTALGAENKWVEVQIRTERMDEIAEKGYAAHWKYKEIQKKEKKNPKANIRISSFDEWLEKARVLLESYAKGEHTAVDFVSDFRDRIVKDEVWVLTPKKEVKTLTKGATALDFAFEIHSDLGRKCLGAKVNNKMVTLSYELQEGDQVEIITSKDQVPNPDWLKFVKTSKARNGIKTYISAERRRLIQKGKEIFERKCKSLKIEPTQDLLKQLRIFYKLNQPNDFLYNLGKGVVSPREISKYKKWLKDNPQRNIVEEEIAEKPKKKVQEYQEIIIGKGAPFEYELAPCCNPISGDPIFAYLSSQHSIKIHTLNCPNASGLMANFNHRIKRARWNSDPEESQEFTVKLEVKGNDRRGLVNDVTHVISDELSLNMTGIHLEPGEGLFEGIIKVALEDTLQLRILIEKLKRIPGVSNIRRIND